MCKLGRKLKSVFFPIFQVRPIVDDIVDDVEEEDVDRVLVINHTGNEPEISPDDEDSSREDSAHDSA